MEELIFGILRCIKQIPVNHSLSVILIVSFRLPFAIIFHRIWQSVNSFTDCYEC